MGGITEHEKDEEDEDVCVDYTGKWGKATKEDAFYFLYKWIEVHSCELPCENDAKFMLYKLKDIRI